MRNFLSILKNFFFPEKEYKRKLASIQIISQLEPIEGADFLSKARVLGWDVVVKNGEFRVGDKCVFFEVDSVLKEGPEWAEFMRPRKFRVKTLRLRGVLSQGLALPLSILPENYSGSLKVGTDLTKVLEVKKWVFPVHSGGVKMGCATGKFPDYIPKTDEIRVQSALGLIYELQGKEYYISEKCDGTSFTAVFHEGNFLACSRNFVKREDDNNVYWSVVRRYNINEKLKKAPDYAIQAEICAPGLQRNRLMLKEPAMFVFNVYDVKARRYLDFQDFINFCKEHDFPTVPILEVGDSFSYSFADLLEKAKGKYKGTKNHREGIVVRPKVETKVRLSGYRGRLSFKCINNDFLLKEE